MFRTQNSEMAGLPEMFGEGLTHWNSVSRVLAMHWYHVSVQEFHEGRLITFVHMINDEVRLNDLLTNQSQELIVTDVQVVTPPWMNKCENWKMEKLASVSVGFDKNDVVVCLLQVEGGAAYSDTHDRNFDVGALTDLRRIY